MLNDDILHTFPSMFFALMLQMNLTVQKKLKHDSLNLMRFKKMCNEFLLSQTL